MEINCDKTSPAFLMICVIIKKRVNECCSGQQDILKICSSKNINGKLPHNKDTINALCETYILSLHINGTNCILTKSIIIFFYLQKNIWHTHTHNKTATAVGGLWWKSRRSCVRVNTAHTMHFKKRSLVYFPLDSNQYHKGEPVQTTW